MSLPHAKRVKQLDAFGKEDVAPDQDLWELHAVVHKAIQVLVGSLLGAVPVFSFIIARNTRLQLEGCIDFSCRLWQLS